MLETQTQIIGAGLPLQPTSTEARNLALQDSLQRTHAYLEVCLCDNTTSGHTLQYGWEQCSLHDAVKLSSMKGCDVLLHVRNERGEIVPVRGEA